MRERPCSQNSMRTPPCPRMGTERWRSCQADRRASSREASWLALSDIDSLYRFGYSIVSPPWHPRAGRLFGLRLSALPNLEKMLVGLTGGAITLEAGKTPPCPRMGTERLERRCRFWFAFARACVVSLMIDALVDAAPSSTSSNAAREETECCRCRDDASRHREIVDARTASGTCRSIECEAQKRNSALECVE